MDIDQSVDGTEDIKPDEEDEQVRLLLSLVINILGS